MRLALSQNQPAELALWLERLSPESKNKEVALLASDGVAIAR